MDLMVLDAPATPAATPPPPAVLYAEADLARVKTHPFLGSRAAVFTARSPAKDTVNEDAIALIQAGPHSGVIVVADGLGGPPAGEQASRLAVQTLAETVRDAAVRGRPLREAILAGLDLANAAILARGSGAATTLAVVEIHEGVIRTYHVGDAMFLVTGQRGKVKLHSIAHSPVGYAVEAGLLDADEAVHHAERNLVSNVLGAPDMRIEMGPPRRLAARDTLLVASDGLADNLYLEEIVEGVRKGPLRRVTAELVARCQARMRAPEADQPHHPDDLSVVVFRLPPPRRQPRPAAAAPTGDDPTTHGVDTAAPPPPDEAPAEPPDGPRTDRPRTDDPHPDAPPVAPLDPEG